jgi:hypothetical protein
MSNGIENIKKYVDKELMGGYIIVVMSYRIKYVRYI